MSQLPKFATIKNQTEVPFDGHSSFLDALFLLMPLGQTEKKLNLISISNGCGEIFLKKAKNYQSLSMTDGVNELVSFPFVAW